MSGKHRQATKSSDNSRVPAWVWLFTGVVLGAFIMFLMRLSDVQDSSNTPLNIDTENKQVKGQENQQKPRFDFYDLLKETHVPISRRPQATEAPQDNADAAQTDTFLLQVASFKSVEDADRLRAELILLNLEAKTEEAKIRNGETWHRVIVGPFSSQSKLAKARATLLGNHYEALVLKRQAEG